MKIQYLVLFMVINAGISMLVAEKVFDRRIKNLEAIECDMIISRAVYTGYIGVRGRNIEGEQPAVTINAGSDFAGMQVTNGGDFAIVWCDEKDGPVIETKEK